MNKNIDKILKLLTKEYGPARTDLRHKDPFQLLVATILSAQCTDERVNKVTPGLFKKYPSVKDFAKAKQDKLEEDIRSTGFFRNKAKNIIGSAKKIISDFNGSVPDNMDELITLPGVARKTANVLLGNSFGKTEGIVVDTHVLRLSQRLGFSKNKTADKVERDLMKIIPEKSWIDLPHQLILHGRRICKARKPECGICMLEEYCPKVGIK
ncbi:MAG: endonuclease III [Armatimonadota bacterium]